MNQVYLTGVASEISIVSQKDDIPNHVQMVLSVQHKTADGDKRIEQYPIHMWNKIAEWAAGRIKQNDLLTVFGYLTNRSGIAVAAREILIGQGRTTVPQTDDKVDESNESVEEEKNQKKDV